jgi:hypothetical protein
MLLPNVANEMTKIIAMKQALQINKHSKSEFKFPGGNTKGSL